MCIGIYVPGGVMHPKKTVLKQCFQRNSDGAGYAVWNPRKKKWHIKKGFMTWGAFWKSFNAEQFKENQILFIHFRISTSGKYIGRDPAPECTHPFPIVDGYEDMQKLDFLSPNIAMHNGVCGTGDGDASDTMVAINDLVEPLCDRIHRPKIRDIIYDLVAANKCRWAYGIKSDVYLDGEWIEDEKTKIFYSNSGYEKPKPVVTNHRYAPGSPGMGVTPYAGTTPLSRVPNIKDIPADINYISDTASQYVVFQGKWDWNIWKTFEDAYYKIAAGAAATNTADTSGLQEIFSDDEKLLALVDQHGNVLWNDDDGVDTGKGGIDEPALEDYIKEVYTDNQKLVGYSCKMCGVTFATEELLQGDCPTCLGFGFDPDAVNRVQVDEGLFHYDCIACGEVYDSLDDLVSGRCPVCFGHGTNDYLVGPPSKTLVEDIHYLCTKCEVISRGADLQDDECPACGSKINRVQDVTVAEIVTCPSCNDHKYLVDTTMHVGDSECMRCGAVFMDGARNVKDIILYNTKTAAAHNKNRDMMEGK